MQAEKALWAAVLQQAIDDLSCRAAKTKHAENERPNIVAAMNIRESARAWFMSRRYAINSFRGICDILGLDPGRILLKHQDKIFIHEYISPIPDNSISTTSVVAHG